MKTLFWLPTLLGNVAQSLLPRSLFVMLYKPATSEYAAIEQDTRNKMRLAAYHLKKSLGA